MGGVRSQGLYSEYITCVTSFNSSIGKVDYIIM